MTLRSRLVAVFLLLALPAAARPTPFDRAYEAGQDAYHLGRLDDAAAHFAHARDLAPDKPGPWRWLGRTNRARKRWDDCLEAAIRALRLSPRSPYAPEVRRDIDACRAGLGRPPFQGKLGPGQGAIFVPLGPTAVAVDGINRGAPPLVFAVNPGKHTIVLVGASGAPISVDVLPGVVHDVTIPAIQ